MELGIADGLSEYAKNRLKNFINLSDKIGEIDPLKITSEYRQLASKINLLEEEVLNTYSYFHHSIINLYINYKKVNYIFTINKNEGVKFVSAN